MTTSNNEKLNNNAVKFFGENRTEYSVVLEVRILEFRRGQQVPASYDYSCFLLQMNGTMCRWVRRLYKKAWSYLTSYKHTCILQNVILPRIVAWLEITLEQIIACFMYLILFVVAGTFFLRPFPITANAVKVHSGK
jgi:hypothetical protein